MPFLLGALALIYYIPYMFHKVVNHDIVRLKRDLDKEEPSPPAIYKYYFKNNKGTTVDRSPVVMRQLLILAVKVIYVLVNIGAFVVLDGNLNGLFFGFGSKWFDWASLTNTDQFDYMGGSEHPKPGK